MIAFTRDTLTPNTSDRTLHKPKRPKSRRTQYFGYGVSREWLEEYGLKHTFIPEGPNTHVSTNAVFNALEKITRDARLGTWHHVRADEHDFVRSLTCFAVGHNKSQEGKDKITPERIQRLKEVLGITEEPRWWKT